ncbi:MAG TPA: GNAT family N-acetyltransferase [Azospirillaceae bacterium]|nr:GNAT family N-acetyltransferase [Azospirillaceae bacterium]
MNESLRQELLAMAAEDARVRTELAATGELFQGYHPRMRAVHEANADALAALLDRHGWPQPLLAGKDGAEAAWLVVCHAISRPALFRRCLPLVRAEVEAGRLPGGCLARLIDRIAWFEGRPQTYGTHFDWDEEGHLSPMPAIAEPGTVDARRAALGIGPLEETVRRLRAEAAAEGAPAPADWQARRREIDAFAVEVGWRPPPGPVRIPTPRLVLRPFADKDRPALVAALNDWRVAQWLIRTPHPFTQSDADAFLAGSGAAPADRVSLRLAIAAADGDALVGCATIRPEGEDAEVGYWLVPDAQGKGYATEALRGMLGFLFGPFHRRRATATTDAENAPSQAVLRRAGFAPAGAYDRPEPNRRGRTRMALFELRREEWREG